MWQLLPDELRAAIANFAVVAGLAWLGRMTWHVRKVQKRERRFFSWHLAWELVIALFIAFAADGLVTYLGLTGKPAIGVIVVVAYLGPGGIEQLIQTLVKRYAGAR